AIIYPLPLSPLIISSIDTFIDVKTLNGTYIDNINEAYNNRTYEFGNTYSGIGSEGIRISMYIDGNGKIISAFPSE
ncbi:EndoU domain-containing protein, partial [Bacillus mycoides]|uniref:EndoU domain-containing protein n=1 Tax=Bacillus mycoides TaxID=1405 RepID=UPI003CFECA30